MFLRIWIALFLAIMIEVHVGEVFSLLFNFFALVWLLLSAVAVFKSALYKREPGLSGGLAMASVVLWSVALPIMGFLGSIG